MPGESKRSLRTKVNGADAPRPIGLSKSRYTLGLQCHKRLWWTVHEPDAPELVPDGALQAVFDQGHLVGELAREQFPGGTLIDIEHWKASERVQATAEALAAGAKVVYEASFRADNVFVSVDVLHRARGKRGFTLTEVKSTLSAKESHIDDVAVQTHVVRKAGLPVSRVEVMHVNRDCHHPDLSNLFLRTNVTSEVKKSLDGIPREIRRQLRVLRSDEPPDVTPGPHCFDPWECPFLERCHEPAPEYSIETLCTSRKRRQSLADAGYRTILDLPDDLGLDGVADRQRRAVQAGDVVVDDGLAEALDALVSPVAHLDFETIAPAVPAWPGCSPYRPVPVQFSVRLDGTGKRGGRETSWLAEGPEDPRRPLAHALVRALQGTGSVIAYNASFEAERIRELAAAVPELAGELLGIIDRLVDLLPLVRQHVYHPEFNGSFGLKSVAPALVPGFSYDELEVGDGTTASNALQAMLIQQEPRAAGERKRLRHALLQYCATDTLATALVLGRLRRLASYPGSS